MQTLHFIYLNVALNIIRKCIKFFGLNIISTKIIFFLLNLKTKMWKKINSLKKIFFNFLFSTGDITQKGYEKKRTRLLQPYIQKNAQQGKNISVFHLQFLYFIFCVHFPHLFIKYEKWLRFCWMGKINKL